mmetsp:Transcript_11618/g.35829  ORF Transcript_11618/g.35829 Transcript_11618/m.35829 type:complete len:246 (-) Transcript_11618:411-1148(-)
MVSSVMPPDASTNRCGNCFLSSAAATFKSAGAMLSSMTMSAPAPAASTPSAKSRASTSILAVNPAAVLAVSTAFAMEPRCQTWLSLSMTICDRSRRCVAAPPTSSAYFSTMRKPGVVLRVPATWPCQPAARATSTAARAAVATPDARDSAFSAVRSPKRSFRAGPDTVATATLPPVASTCSPSRRSHATVQSPSASNVASKNGVPARTPELLHQSVAVVRASPTTSPPTSSDGQSSRSHAATVSR